MKRYVCKQNLRDIFSGKERDGGIAIAINQWGYSLKEVDKFGGLHHAWVSVIAKKNKT